MIYDHPVSTTTATALPQPPDVILHHYKHDGHGHEDNDDLLEGVADLLEGVAAAAVNEASTLVGRWLQRRDLVAWSSHQGRLSVWWYPIILSSNTQSLFRPLSKQCSFDWCDDEDDDESYTTLDQGLR